MRSLGIGKTVVLLTMVIISMLIYVSCVNDSSKAEIKEETLPSVAAVSIGTADRDVQTAYDMINQNVVFGNLKVKEDKYDFDIVVEIETFNREGKSEIKELYRILADTLKSQVEDGKPYQMTVGQDFTTWSGQLLLPDAVVYFSLSPSLVDANVEDIAQVMDFLDAELSMNHSTRVVRLAFTDRNDDDAKEDEQNNKDEGYDGKAIAYIRLKPVPKEQKAQ